MTYKYINMDELTRPKNHSFRLHSDCFITSIAATLGFTYEEVYDDLFRLAQKCMLLPNDPYVVLPTYLKYYGFEFKKLPGDPVYLGDRSTTDSRKDINSDTCVTVGELIDQGQEYTLIIVSRKHMFAYKSGTIYNDVRHKDGSTNYTKEDELEILASPVAYYYICKTPLCKEKRFEISVNFAFKGRYAKVYRKEAIEAFEFLNKRTKALVDNVLLRYGSGTDKCVLCIDKDGVVIHPDKNVLILKGKFTPGTNIEKIQRLPLSTFTLRTVIENSSGTFNFASDFLLSGIRCYEARMPFKSDNINIEPISY